MNTLTFQPKLPDIVSMDDVRIAANNISQFAHRTPVITSETLNRIVGHQLFFKCENFQKTGAFKFRGAINALSHLSPEELDKGVVTHSSGNHAGALAHAAQIFGTTAHIVMPSNSSRVKKAAVVGYGARIIECEPTLQARQDSSAKVQQETGAIMIPPFNHRHVIAGQGTAAMEFLEQVPNLEFIVAPIGGGGLMSGTCVSTHSITKRCIIIGAEPAGADDAFQSKQQGKFIPQDSPNTIADGLRTSLGDLTWPYVRDVVKQVITAGDDAIVSAMKLFLERTKILIEPSSAICLAALIESQFTNKIDGSCNIGVIISGGNVDLDQLPW